ncbi:MAG: hypothetical protein HQM10_02280 [Candidatus Riflebacteria bacterium]|nr:hypothetical protein [Candidatus Riflebacteria bacterium]
MKRFSNLVLLSFLVLVLFVSSAYSRALVQGNGIPIVSDPKDLSLVDLAPLNEYLKSNLKEKGVLGTLRRLAFERKAVRLGFENPGSPKFHGGAVVARGSSGNSSVVVVLIGDLDYSKFISEYVRDFQEYRKVNKEEGKMGSIEIDGLRFNTFNYFDRPYFTCIGRLPKQNALIIASIPTDDLDILQNTLAVVKGSEQLNKALPSEVDVQTTFQLTNQEIQRLLRFNSSKNSLRTKAANGMAAISRRIGISNTEDPAIPLEEQIRRKIAQSSSVTTKYHWERNPKESSAYSVTYLIQMKSTSEADSLRELISEEITRISERSTKETEKESFGRLTVQASDCEVSLSFLLDSLEAQYEHISMLFSQALQYRNMTSFLDRYGSN